MISEIIYYSLVILLIFALFMNVLRKVTKRISRKNSIELSWYILANLVFEKESLKKMNKLIKEVNNKPMNFIYFDYKKVELRRFLEIPLMLNTTHWIEKYYGVKQMNWLEKVYKMDYYYVTQKTFPQFWESQVQFEMFEDLEFLKGKILCLQPERKDELEHKIKLSKLSHTFEGKN